MRKKAVFGVVADEGRVNSYVVCERTGLEEETPESILDRLISSRPLREVPCGLFDSVEAKRDDNEKVGGIPKIPDKDTQTAPIDPTEFYDDQ